jgi:hypothetical protein
MMVLHFDPNRPRRERHGTEEAIRDLRALLPKSQSVVAAFIRDLRRLEAGLSAERRGEMDTKGGAR